MIPERQMNDLSLELKVAGRDGRERRLRLGPPVEAGRTVRLAPPQAPNAFSLPPLQAEAHEVPGWFVGDVRRGGSCNVEVLRCTAHGLTHVETAAHLLDPAGAPPTVADLPPERLAGLMLLADLSDLGEQPGALVPPDRLIGALAAGDLPMSMLGLKTRASALPPATDFTGTDFLALSPEAAAAVREAGIRTLVTDLPSLDPERDGGRLLAHRSYFGLPVEGCRGTDPERRAVVELAWFGDLPAGYYYAVVTPARFAVPAVPTGLLLYPVQPS
jgi:arylformamidase